MSCGVGRRCVLDLALLWLQHRPAATALIPPLAWELPYAAGGPKKQKKKKKRERERDRKIKGKIFCWHYFAKESQRSVCKI